MPTRNRPRFVEQALCCFARQTWQACELIVVDDGEVSVRSLCDGLPRIRYVRLDQSTPTGTKLNIGMASATGSILQKLDDDDYYAPRFVETAVSAVNDAPGDAIVAWDCFLVLIAGERQPRFSGHGWTAGGTLSFRRDVWRRTSFRDLWKGSDSRFLVDHDVPIVPVCKPELYVLVRHGANTWTDMDGESTDDYMSSLPPYDKPLEALVEREAIDFYLGLPPLAG